MANLTGRGAPTDHTVGAKGDTYTNELTGVKYQCTGVVGIYAYGDDSVTYCWSVMDKSISWNDLADKPFDSGKGVELVNIIVDSNNPNNGTNAYYPVYYLGDFALTHQTTYTVSIDDMVESLVAAEDYWKTNIAMETSDYKHRFVYVSEPKTNMNINESPTTLPVKGVYMVCSSEADFHVVIAESGPITTIDPMFLPKAAAIEDLTEAPTASDFNALLTSLRNAGYLAE